jgi:hypothetical protein
MRCSSSEASAIESLCLVLNLSCRHRVGGNADNFRSRFGECALEAGKIDGLFRASGGVRPGIEIEHELAPCEVGQRDAFAAVAEQGERRRFHAGTEFAGHLPSFRAFVPRLPFDAFDTAFLSEYARAKSGSMLAAKWGFSGWRGGDRVLTEGRSRLG